MSHIERPCDTCGKVYWTFAIKGVPQRRNCSDECTSLRRAEASKGQKARPRTLALTDLQCASEEEKRSWLQMARRCSPTDMKAPLIDVFCSDGLPDWCRGQAAEGRCVRVKREAI